MDKLATLHLFEELLGVFNHLLKAFFTRSKLACSDSAFQNPNIPLCREVLKFAICLQMKRLTVIYKPLLYFVFFVITVIHSFKKSATKDGKYGLSHGEITDIHNPFRKVGFKKSFFFFIPLKP